MNVNISSVYSVVKVLWKETAFPRWRATDSRWNRYVVSLVSSVTAVIRRPSSCTDSTACHGVVRLKRATCITQL